MKRAALLAASLMIALSPLGGSAAGARDGGAYFVRPHGGYGYGTRFYGHDWRGSDGFRRGDDWRRGGDWRGRYDRWNDGWRDRSAWRWRGEGRGRYDGRYDRTPRLRLPDPWR